MSDKIIGSGVILTPFFRFITGSGVGLNLVFVTGGTATFEWISPDGSISTGAVPNPALDQTGAYTVKCTDWSDVTQFNTPLAPIIALTNLTVFSALTTLNCATNSISVLDVSTLKTLTTLDCRANSISVLDVSALTALTMLNCLGNNIDVLEVSALTVLMLFACNNNGMNEASIDQILAGLVVAGAIGGTALMHGTNAAPSAAGNINKAILVGRGWMVLTS